MAQRATAAKKTSKKSAKKSSRSSAMGRTKKTTKKTAKKTSKKSGHKASASNTGKLPRVGQTVTWRAMPGDVEGKVIEILRADTSLNGKKIRASPQEPRIKLRSSASGKICIHKPENIHVVR